MALFRKFSYAAARKSPETADLLSIVENLNNVLNSKRDFGSPLRDFGVRDLGLHMTREDMARVVMQDVRECIERYEPRVELQRIVLEKDDNPMRLSFTIQCNVRRNARSLRMVFDTMFGSVAVRSPAEG